MRPTDQAANTTNKHSDRPDLRDDGGEIPEAVRFIDVRKTFGELHAVDGVGLAIEDGEFFSLLGPSGSGKTTCLRMLGGFEAVTTGQILLHGTDVSNMPPYRRDLNTVFQDYALFPHMTVEDNVGYGLMIGGVAKRERAAQVAESLERVALGDLAKRKPNQLSGGQRQRVALARALINRPSVLLLDEPLGALDLQLRRSMQVELKALQRDVGITFVFVTHDQEEALTMSDRIAVMNQGKVAQVGSPNDLYENPTSRFVATFIGHSNVIDSSIAEELTGRKQPFVVRPERVILTAYANHSDAPSLQAVPDNHIRVDGHVVASTFLGMYFQVRVRCSDGTEIVAAIANAESGIEAFQSPGVAVTASWSPSACRWLDAESDSPAGTASLTESIETPKSSSKTTDLNPSQQRGNV